MAKKRLGSRRLEHDIFGRVPRSDGINSKKKGDGNEVVAASVISDWTGEKFTRVPRSGGLSWKNNKSVYGDIVCTNEDFNFVFNIETKFYNGIEVYHPKLRKNSIIFKFWQQCRHDAEKSGKEPMLLVRANKMKKREYVLYISNSFWLRIRPIIIREGYLPEPEIIATGMTDLDGQTESIVGFWASNFFEELPYKFFANVF